jgi:hypothetical protein
MLSPNIKGRMEAYREILDWIETNDDCGCDGSPDTMYTCPIHELEHYVQGRVWRLTHAVSVADTLTGDE